MRQPVRVVFFALCGLLQAGAGCCDEFDVDLQEGLIFDDQVLDEPLEYPTWFKSSFLDLREDMVDALQSGKRGIIVYFGQKRCAYCKALMEVNFGKEDIVTYTQTYFDLIPIDIWGIDELTDLDGNEMTEREYAIREGTNFTPSLIFYDAAGEIALRLRGYYPPYKFKAALEYVADGHHLEGSFAKFLALAEPGHVFEEGGLNEADFFNPPPHDLSRHVLPSSRPLIVYFEQGNCYACDLLHSGPLQDPVVEHLLEKVDAVQLNMHSDEPVVTPAGMRTSAREWARQLGLFYTPTLMFFDEHGEEILRLDSVVQIYRLRNVLRFITSKAYLDFPTYAAWRLQTPNPH
ncbi:MAG TPA: thioredoxin [Chromatiaceae bacterium]|jgi:thioredoxin-related protein|nr:thioredoxin [Chromatiaceae bacterium]HIB85304.1 thioredoxin [Chromatiaceae bacterium]HIO14583.1 thioredoxin [Chromatiales bacterium]HIO55373.1 thioredoxin [Chromatiales bacterium]